MRGSRAKGQHETTAGLRLTVRVSGSGAIHKLREPDPMAPPPAAWWEYTLEDRLDEWVACINVATLPPGA